MQWIIQFLKIFKKKEQLGCSQFILLSFNRTDKICINTDTKNIIIIKLHICIMNTFICTCRITSLATFASSIYDSPKLNHVVNCSMRNNGIHWKMNEDFILLFSDWDEKTRNGDNKQNFFFSFMFNIFEKFM